MTTVLSGCRVRAEIQQRDIDTDAHYFRCIKFRLETLYELTTEPNIREQISDEVDWIEAKLSQTNT